MNLLAWREADAAIEVEECVERVIQPDLEPWYALPHIEGDGLFGPRGDLCTLECYLLRVIINGKRIVL